MNQPAYLSLIVLLGLAATGCDGKLLFAGNMAVATIPCLLLYLTVNLKKGG